MFNTALFCGITRHVCWDTIYRLMHMAFSCLAGNIALSYSPSAEPPYCHLWFCLCSANLAFYCLPEGPTKVLHLQPKGPHSAVLVDLNVISPYTHTTDRQTGAARCRLEVVAPAGHKLTVHLDHPKALTNRTSEKRHGFLPCFLKLVSICDAVLLLNVCLWRGQDAGKVGLGVSMTVAAGEASTK